MNNTELSSKMTEKVFIFDLENKVDNRHGYICVVSSTLFFGLLNVIVSKIGKPKTVRDDAWRWNNLLISWIHGLIVGTWDILCFCLYPELLGDLYHHINYFTYLMVAFSAGYFIYDFLDLTYRGKIISSWELTLHHIAVTSMFLYNVHAKMCIGFNVIALMAEINSFFLHSRKLLHMLQYDFRNKFYQTVCMLNLVTFFFCRGVSTTRMSYAAFTDYDLVPKSYLYCYICAMTVMNVINPVLFWRLLKNDLLRNWKSSKPEIDQKNSHVNGNNNQPDHLKSS